MISQSDRPLIIGAGPVGLGAALFLARQGQPPRVVEERSEPTQHSKALIRVPFIRARMIGTVTGLDHELPIQAAAEATQSLARIL